MISIRIVLSAVLCWNQIFLYTKSYEQATAAVRHRFGQMGTGSIMDCIVRDMIRHDPGATTPQCN